MTACARTPWHCLDCPETGDTQASATRHGDDTQHATTTATTPEAAARIAARARAGRREG